jgi:hypothetical protein
MSQDEVDPACWANSPKISAWLRQHSMNASDLYPYFEAKVAAILHSAGKRMMAVRPLHRTVWAARRALSPLFPLSPPPISHNQLPSEC